MKKLSFLYFHIGYWVILWIKELLFGYQTFNIGELTFDNVILVLTVKLIGLTFPLCIFYLNFSILVPKLIRNNKILLYILSVIVLFAVLAPVHRYVYGSVLPQKFSWYAYVYVDKLSFWLSFQTLLFENYVYIFFSIALSYVKDFFAHQQRQQELEKEQALTELAYLKSQINPHFLFNTLNDIYALTYQQAKEAPTAVMKLSELLRYMLKESNDKFAPIENEINYLKNVIALYQIGQKGLAYIDLNISGISVHQQIAPLILINFVENAFKHGVVDDLAHPVTISIDIDENAFNFKVVNQKNTDQKDATGGIGLRNVKRRLALIYPGQHVLQIENGDDTFTITLKIEWKTSVAQ
jgi:two-component system LytT family sensor kinase